MRETGDRDSGGRGGDRGPVMGYVGRSRADLMFVVSLSDLSSVASSRFSLSLSVFTSLAYITLYHLYTLSRKRSPSSATRLIASPVIFPFSDPSPHTTLRPLPEREIDVFPSVFDPELHTSAHACPVLLARLLV